MLDNSAKELRRQYLKKWRKQNPDKTKEYNQRYWEKKAREANENGEEEDHSCDN